MASIFVLHCNLQEKFKTIHSINFTNLSIQGCPLKTRFSYAQSPQFHFKMISKRKQICYFIS